MRESIHTSTQRVERNGFTVERPVIRASGSNRVREDDAARYIGCSPRKLRKMRAEDQGPNFDLIAGRVWYELGELDAYLELCRHETTA